MPRAQPGPGEASIPRACLASIPPTARVVRLMLCWVLAQGRICVKHLKALVRYNRRQESCTAQHPGVPPAVAVVCFVTQPSQRGWEPAEIRTEIRRELLPEMSCPRAALRQQVKMSLLWVWGTSPSGTIRQSLYCSRQDRAPTPQAVQRRSQLIMLPQGFRRKKNVQRNYRLWPQMTLTLTGLTVGRCVPCDRPRAWSFPSGASPTPSATGGSWLTGQARGTTGSQAWSHTLRHSGVGRTRTLWSQPPIIPWPAITSPSRYRRLAGTAVHRKGGTKDLRQAYVESPQAYSTSCVVQGPPPCKPPAEEVPARDADFRTSPQSLCTIISLGGIQESAIKEILTHIHI